MYIHLHKNKYKNLKKTNNSYIFLDITISDCMKYCTGDSKKEMIFFK